MSPINVKSDPLEVFHIVYDVDKAPKNLMIPIGLNDKYEEFYLKSKLKPTSLKSSNKNIVSLTQLRRSYMIKHI